MTTSQLIAHLRQGRPVSSKLIRMVIRDLELLEAQRARTAPPRGIVFTAEEAGHIETALREYDRVLDEIRDAAGLEFCPDHELPDRLGLMMAVR